MAIDFYPLIVVADDAVVSLHLEVVLKLLLLFVAGHSLLFLGKVLAEFGLALEEVLFFSEEFLGTFFCYLGV